MKVNRFIVIGIVVLLTVMTACNNESANSNKVKEGDLDNLNEEGMPIVKNTITLDFFSQKRPSSADDYNDVLLYNKYEEETNINVNWEMPPEESIEEKRNLALGGGSLPDAFHSADMPKRDIAKYGKQGIFIPLNDLIDKYAPNLKQLLDDNPEVEKALTFPDGNIYSFPQMTEPEFLSMRMGAKPWINETWLEALDMDMPETTEEFYTYLEAVKTEDPNENGEQDEIPYGAPSIDTLYNYLLGSFGLANNGSENPYIDLDPETNDLRFYPVTDQYKELLQYMHKLYDDELIAQNIFSISHTQYLSDSEDGKYGSNVWYDPNPEAEQSNQHFIGMPALEGPNGDKAFTTFSSPLMNIGAFVITDENEHPEATVRWIDHFYGEEGMKEFFMGFEGETYEINDDGKPEYMDHILDSDDGLSRDQEIAKYLTFPGGGYPAMMTQDYFQGAEISPDALDAADRVKPDLVEDSWAPFIYTNEEEDKLDAFGADIDKYVEEMRDKFIAGKASFDEWDDYVNEIESMKLDDYMKIKKDAYDRYLEN